MVSMSLLRDQYFIQPLSVRLAELADKLRLISDSARNTAESDALPALMLECEYMINWTAAEFEAEFASKLVDILRMLALWRSGWPDAQKNLSLRALLYLQTDRRTDRVGEPIRSSALP